MRIFLSAGEASGDEHGAALARALTAATPAVQLEGIGGPAMASAGVELLHDLRGLQAVGLVEAAGTLPAHVRAFRSASQAFRTKPWDLLVTIDYPGFHGVLATAARRRGIPVVQYIAPQLWAWGDWRVSAFRRRIDHALVILPFEEPFFRERGVRATFVGHPLRDTIPLHRAAARRNLGISNGAPVLSLFPGSRPSEHRTLWPLFRDVAARIRDAMPEVEVLIGTRTAEERLDLRDLPARVVPAPLAAAAATAALAKSGTTTLELALTGTPHVLAYRVHALTFAAARRLIRVPWIGLVNLILGRPIVPEFLQHGLTVDRVWPAVAALLDEAAPPARRQKEAFAEVADRLGPPGAAARAAALALEVAA